MSAGLANPFVADGRGSHVHTQVDDGADTCVTVQVPARGLAEVIVDNDDFEGLKGLRPGGLNCFVNELFPVVVRDCDWDIAGPGIEYSSRHVCAL
jgi:hypothetical protein